MDSERLLTGKRFTSAISIGFTSAIGFTLRSGTDSTLENSFHVKVIGLKCGDDVILNWLSWPNSAWIFTFLSIEFGILIVRKRSYFCHLTSTISNIGVKVFAIRLNGNERFATQQINIIHKPCIWYRRSCRRIFRRLSHSHLFNTWKNSRFLVTR